MTKYHRFNLTKSTIFLTDNELVYLLSKDVELYKKCLQRGKAFGRYESKNAQYEKKFSYHESEILNKHIQ